MLRKYFIAAILVLFALGFIWFIPKVFRRLRRMFRAVGAFFMGEGFSDEAIR